MFIEERHQVILDYLEKNGRVSAAEIQERFHVSFDTARRDFMNTFQIQILIFSVIII